MLGEQLSKLRQNQQIHEIRPKTAITFSDSEHLDDETLYELINFQTEFTSSEYRHFDRYKLTMQKEKQFNQKFKKYLKGLVLHRNEDCFNYLLDFLQRTFYMDVFNAEELIFAILPSKEYEGQLKMLSGRVAFLKDYSHHGVDYFARLLLKDVYFFDLFLEYFRYYEHVRVFVDGVVDCLCSLNGYAKSLDRIYSLLYELAEVKCIEQFIMLYNSLEKDCDLAEEFVVLRKKVEEMHDITQIVTKENAIPLNNTKRYKIEGEAEYKINVHEVIEQLKDQDIVDTEYIEGIIRKVSDVQILLKFLVLKLDASTINNLFGVLRTNEISYIKEYITPKNITCLLNIHGDAVLSYLPRNFINGNKEIIFETILELENSTFHYFNEFISIDDVKNHKYKSEISIRNLLKICLIKEFDYKGLLFSPDIFNTDTMTFILLQCSDISLQELTKIFQMVANTNSEYFLGLFLARISSMEVEEVFLKEVMSFFVQKNLCEIQVIGILEANYDRFKFIHELSKRFIQDKTGKEYAVLIQKVIENEDGFDCNVFMNESNKLLLELLQKVSIEKLINSNNDVFIRNFCHIRDSFIAIENLLDYNQNTNDVLKSNLKSFVGLSIENGNLLLEDMVECFVTHGIFYLNLFYFYNDKLSSVLIYEGLERHIGLYNNIFMIISDDINSFFTTYFALFLKIRKSLSINENIILYKLKDDKLAEMMVDNFNIFLLGFLKKENILFDHFNTILCYTDESNTIELIKKYKNILIPYLEIIMSRFVNNPEVCLTLLQIEGIEILRVMVKLYSTTNDIQYVDLISMFFNANLNSDYKLIVGYFLCKVNTFLQHTDLISSFLAYCSLNKIKQKLIQKIIDHYQKDVLLKMFSTILKSGVLYFYDYIDECLNELTESNFTHIECVTLFFKGEVESAEISGELLNKVIMTLFNNTLNDDSVLQCLCSLLSFSEDKGQMSEINTSILKAIKNDGKQEMFDVLDIFYCNIKGYVGCLRESVPYFSLLLDHKNREIQNRTKDLLINIEKYTNENPYNYLD